jgi:hypothetical protein
MHSSREQSERTTMDNHEAASTCAIPPSSQVIAAPDLSLGAGTQRLMMDLGPVRCAGSMGNVFIEPRANIAKNRCNTV